MAERSSVILDVATRMFAERGFRRTDVQDIADAAGVGKGTVYRHFGDKKDLFLATVDKGTDELKDVVLKRIASCRGPVETIEVGLREYFKFFDEHQDLVEIFIQERSEFRGKGKSRYFANRDKNIRIFEAVLSDGIKRGVFRRLNVKRTAEILADLAYGTVVANLMKGSRDKLVSRTKDVLEVYFNGILNHPRRRCKSP
ncbi:MAG: TetR/AcrR family transcriptional regulator [Planctomycetota bacterium]